MTCVLFVTLASFKCHTTSLETDLVQQRACEAEEIESLKGLCLHVVFLRIMLSLLSVTTFPTFTIRSSLNCQHN